MKSSSIPGLLTGRTVLFALVAFFGVVIGVNMLMMTLAIKTLPGTDVDSAYKASLAYESEILAARDQDVRNWQIDAHLERKPDGLATLRIEAHDRAGVPLAKISFAGRLERPTDRRADQTIDLIETANGIYRGDTSGVGPGQWDLVIEGNTQDKRLFLSKSRVVLN